MPNGLGEEQRLLGAARGVGYCLENCGQVAHGNPFSQQALEHLFDVAHADQARHELLQQARLFGLECFEQLARLGATQDLVGMTSNRLGQVSGQHRGRVDDRVAEALAAFPIGDADPRRR